MTPSEILEGLRNDGRSVHHRTVLEQELDQAERKLADLKREIIDLSEVDNSVLTDQSGGS